MTTRNIQAANARTLNIQTANRFYGKRDFGPRPAFTRWLALWIALGLCLTAQAGQAQLSFTITPQNLEARNGQITLQTYTATMTNNYNYDLYLNGDYFTLDAPLSLDDSKFLNLFVFPTDSFGNLLAQPTLAANGGSMQADIFDIDLSGMPNGDYNGVFAVQHGATPIDFADTTAVNFHVTVLTTPEPGALTLLLAAGLTGAGLLARRRRVRAA